MRFLSLFPTALLIPFAFLTSAQTNSSLKSDQTPILRADARAVLVDVVVTDSHGNPVSGLRQQDFKLTEDGKPESVVFFEEHKGTEAAPIEIPTMPPNVFTNVPVAPQADALNVLLLDALNTPETDQSYFRAQVIEFLKSMKPGTPLAVFSLADDLRLVQGFTGSPSTLLASMQDKKYGVKPETTAFSHSTKDDLDDKYEVWKRLMMLGGHGHTDAGINALIQDQENVKSNQAVQRVAITAEALQIIARYLARIPGRKNLIWFASRFPMALIPVASGNGALPIGRRIGGLEPAENVRIQNGKLKETADLLTVSRVAIYPVGARGVETLIGGDADQPYAPAPVEVPEQAEILANYATMRELASETGGEMTTGTNDLSNAIAHAIDNGSHFYTLSYTPSNQKMDEQFRSIEVKIPEAKYKLAYRKGYFALDSDHRPTESNNSSKDKTATIPNPLQPLMLRGAPSSTEILYGARVAPEDPQPTQNVARAGKNEKLTGPVKRYAVDLMVRWNDVKLQPAASGKRTGRVQVELLAYDRDGHALNWAGGTLALNLTPDVYAAIQRTGIPAHFEIDVPSDKDVFLATGVLDLETGKAGTLEVPILPAVAAAPQIR